MDNARNGRAGWNEIRQQVLHVDHPPAPRHDVVVIQEETPPHQIISRSPPPRYYSPTERIVKVEPERHYYTDGRMSNRYGYRRNPNPEYYRSARSLDNRRCCAALWTILALAALAGLAIGLYFGIKAAKQKATNNLPQNRVANGYKGYYVNGVYVVPVTTKPSDTYLIMGADIPCNVYNNNSLITPNPYYPNCDQVTTSIVIANWTTTTTTTPANVYSNVDNDGVWSSSVAAVVSSAVLAVSVICI